MKNLKHILAIFIVCFVLGGAAIFVNSIQNKSNETIPEETTEVAAAVLDTIPFEEKLKQELGVFETQFSKRQKRDIWTLGRGKTIINYLLLAQRFFNAHGGQILYMEELHGNPAVFQSAQLDAISPKGDSLKITLQISENIYRNNASYIAVAFIHPHTVKLTPELVSALNELEIPFDLLITPFFKDSVFFEQLKQIKNKEIYLHILMESANLDRRHRPLRPIYLHQTDEQIEEILDDAMRLLPEAKGVATRFAENAVVHKHLLKATFKPLKKHRLNFIDLSENKKSKTLDVCEEVKLTCKITAPFNPDHRTLDDYLNQQLRIAPRRGNAAVVIPLSIENIAKIKEMKKKAEAKGTTFIKLSKFVEND